MTPTITAATGQGGAGKAALWMIGAVVAFSTMAVAARTLSGQFDTFEIMFYRSLVGIVLVVGTAAATGHLRDVRATRLPLHLVRNLAHFTGQNLWFFAIPLIPLAQVFALEFTSPIWVILLSPLLLGERITKIGLFAALLGFVGILVVTRPTPEAISPGLISAALAAIGFALTAIFTRRLTRAERITSILFWLVTMQAAFGLICAGIDGEIARPSAASVPWLILIGCGGVVAHFCLTTALSLAPAPIVMPIDFARLPLIAVVGAIFYAEPLDIFVFLGAALIFAGNYINITRGQPARPSGNAAAPRDH
ncbi:DMT family transporter [Pseudoroseicyclus tamaricis]|uniref:EamA family transporter n=1 Tax=Pseudoroseicyclus tamaricis TaxID=2705421 RepID=A0A6B2JZ41_9RHOB|nr:DMT family transporter [Pseudoroseicyclus tamaricis]NDV00642.1 EamA family transporter [Pseudoroseicyclus tamaricis]